MHSKHSTIYRIVLLWDLPTLSSGILMWKYLTHRYKEGIKSVLVKLLVPPHLSLII